MASGGLQSRLQTIEKDLRNIKEKALMIDSENINNLVKVIEKVIAEVKKDLNKTKDHLAETKACVEEMGRDFVKKAELQSYLDDQIKEEVGKIVKKSETEDNRPERGLYLTGIGRLLECITSPQEDPCDVVHTILHSVGSLAYYKKIIPILPPSKIRKDTDQTRVYFSSSCH